MSKELPYFKFYTSEWNDGDITLEDYETQGVFINICSLYWSRGCELTEKTLNKRFRNNLENILILTKEGFLVIDDDDLVSIRFLDELANKRDRRASTSRVNGAKGGRPKKPNKPIDNPEEPNTEPNETQLREEKRREEERREDERREEEKRKKYYDFCDNYLIQLNKAAVNGFIPQVAKNISSDSKSWTDAIRLLETADGYEWDDIRSTARYYFSEEITKQEFRIEAFSVSSFRKKFSNIQGSKMKYDKLNQNNGPENR